MLRDISLGRYFPGNSLVHLLDPRTKLLLALVVSVTTLSLGGWSLAVTSVVGLLCVCTAAGLPARFVWRSVIPYFWMVGITVMAHTLSGGEAGFELGALMGLRLFAVILSASVLSWTTAPLTLVDGLSRLGRPLKRLRVPVDQLAAALGIALRFAPIVMDETRSIMQAQSARGADLRGLKKKFRVAIPLLGALFERSFDRAERLATAMESRGYVPGRPRTSFSVLKFAYTDILAVMLVGLVYTCGYFAGYVGRHISGYLS